MATETHINALLHDVEETVQKAHAAVDEMKTAYEKVKEYYRTHESEVQAAEAAAESEVKQLDKGSDTENEEQTNAGKQQSNANSK